MSDWKGEMMRQTKPFYLMFKKMISRYLLYKKFRSSGSIPKSTALLILGSGRSGTSVLTRSLNFLGVCLGDDKLLGPDQKVNPKGYFENERIINIHKEIGSLLRYRPSEPGYENSLKILPLREKLTDYVRKEFSGKPVWGWKDPRTNDYLALWKAILKDVCAEPKYVIIIRNPIDVVASNIKAWGRDETWALRQWQIRTLLSLHDTDDGERIIVSYEELFKTPLECLHRISRTLGLPWPEDTTELQKKLDHFIDPSLQTCHSHTTLSAFAKNERVGGDVKQLYLTAMQATYSQSFFQSRDFRHQIDQLYTNYLRDYGPLYRDPPKKIKKI
jgi:hypothetical protein